MSVQPTFDIELRVLSCDNCGAPVRASTAGGAITCDYCGTQMVIGQRKLEPAAVKHELHGDARIAKLRLQTGRDLPDNPYSTLRPPPGCEALTRSGKPEVIAELEVRFREALALVRADPSFEHQRLLWWCASMLNQGYALNDNQLPRRAMLERAIEEIADPGFRHTLYVNLAGAAAKAGELDAARAWVGKCDPEAEDIMLDSSYRVGLASVLCREPGPDKAAELLTLVGARHGEVPEAFQYRLLFALYRAHGHEQRGDGEAAIAAMSALQGDPQLGHLVVEAAQLNGLAPNTAAALEARAAGAASGPATATATAQADAGPWVVKLVLLIVLLSVAIIGTVLLVLLT